MTGVVANSPKGLKQMITTKLLTNICELARQDENNVCITLAFVETIGESVKHLEGCNWFLKSGKCFFTFLICFLIFFLLHNYYSQLSLISSVCRLKNGTSVLFSNCINKLFDLAKVYTSSLFVIFLNLIPNLRLTLKQ